MRAESESAELMLVSRGTLSTAGESFDSWRLILIKWKIENRMQLRNGVASNSGTLSSMSFEYVYCALQKLQPFSYLFSRHS